MIAYRNLRRMAGTILLISIIGCTTKQTNNTVPQAADGLDSSDGPEHLQDLENLTAMDPSQPPQYEISFTPKEIYGERYSASSGYNYKTVSIDSMDRVYIMNGQEESIHIYNSDGEYLVKIGRKGRGPGEFLDISTIRIHEDRLMAFGFTLKRIHWFDLDSHKVNTQIINLGDLKDDRGELILESVTSAIPLANGNILIGGIDSFRENAERKRGFITYYIMDENGNLISDELFRTVSPEFHGGWRIPSSDEGVVDVSPDGIIYYANTSEFLIQVIDPENDTRDSLRFSYENLPVDREKVLAGVEDDFLRNRIRDAEFGEHWPALHSMIADDKNRLWVSTVTEDTDTYTWWVLKDSGELLAKFDWPRSRKIETIRNGSMYVLEENWEERVFPVQRYEIQLEPI